MKHFIKVIIFNQNIKYYLVICLAEIQNFNLNTNVNKVLYI